MKAFKELMSWIVPIAIGLLLALLIKQFAFQFVRARGLLKASQDSSRQRSGF